MVVIFPWGGACGAAIPPYFLLAPRVGSWDPSFPVAARRFEGKGLCSDMTVSFGPRPGSGGLPRVSFTQNAMHCRLGQNNTLHSSWLGMPFNAPAFFVNPGGWRKVNNCLKWRFRQVGVCGVRCGGEGRGTWSREVSRTERWQRERH
eukprot:gene910-biopygen19708